MSGSLGADRALKGLTVPLLLVAFNDTLSHAMTMPPLLPAASLSKGL
jgi:hypothetical protein